VTRNVMGEQQASSEGGRAIEGLLEFQRRIGTRYILLSMILAAALLFWSLRGIDWSVVAGTLRNARPAYVFLGGVLISGGLFLRAVRWQVLLTAEGSVPTGAVFWATCAGYLGNNLLPARAGEGIRTVIISSRANLSKTFVLTTALAERTLDAVTLVAIGLAVLTVRPSGPVWLATAARPFCIAGAAAIFGIVLAPRFERSWNRVVSRAPIPLRIQDSLLHSFEQVVLGMRSFHNAGRSLRFLILTALIWSNDALVTMVGAHALGLSIPYLVAFLLLAGLGLGSALPSTPGYIGIYQFVAISILVPCGLSRTGALTYILFAQTLVNAVLIVWFVLSTALFGGMKRGRPTARS
jgi:glycosyltransferase 2 family protein